MGTQDEKEQAETALSKAWEFIRVSEAKLAQQEEVDLLPIEGLVSDVCQHVLALPEGEAHRYRPELERLLEALNHLQGGLQGQHTAIREQIGKLNLQKQAAKAYVSTGHLSSGKVSHDKDEKT